MYENISEDIARLPDSGERLREAVTAQPANDTASRGSHDAQSAAHAKLGKKRFQIRARES